MNTLDVLEYGHKTLLSSIEDLSEEACNAGGVCGRWSVKNIVAHLTSYEQLLADVIHTLLVEDSETPTMNDMRAQGGTFNDAQVDRRQAMSLVETVAEYNEAHRNVMALADQLPTETFRENGTMPWYGDDYCLDDFIVYTNYAHKREHSAEINVYRDRLKTV